jgi:septum formation protein
MRAKSVGTTHVDTDAQVVVHEGRILEKPANAEEARSFIAGYARSPPSTVGSVVCTDLATGSRVQGVDTAHIHFTPIPDATVDQLMREGDCLYCAGGLMVEHPLVVPHVTRIDGTQDSVMGLSKALTVRLLLQAAGILPR